ncbi:MAG TPA: hypothetical protein VFB16_03550 [Bauldia sp.]|nr:hypothetical protein [Bauldia sp.]
MNPADPLPGANAGLLWEIGWEEFLAITVLIGGAGAYMTGRAVALTWRSSAQLVAYIVALAAAVRFVHFALFQGTLLSIHYYLVDFVILIFLAFLGMRATRVRQMVGQYGWLYQNASPLAWRARRGA